MLFIVRVRIYSGLNVYCKNKVGLNGSLCPAEGREIPPALHFCAIGGSIHGQDAVTPAAQECACSRIHAESV